MPVDLSGKRIIPYARASRLAGRDPEEALREYRLKCERWADAEGRGVVLLPFKGDVDQSGGKLYGRPALEDVMDAIASGEADGVVTPYVSRFSRAGLADALDRINEIRLLGAVFIPLDVSDALSGSDLALNIALTIAAEELRRHRENWRAGDRRAAELGVWLGPPPAGYRHIKGPSPIRGGHGGKLEPDPVRGPALAQAFRLHAEHGEAAPAVAYLREHDDDEHRHTWSPTRWRRTASSRVYLGETTWNAWETIREARRDERGRLEREESGRLKFDERRVLVETITRYGQHEPLVDERTWYACQAGHYVEQRRPSATYPLSITAVHCERCGTELIGSRSGGHRMYRCGTSGGRRGIPLCGPFSNLWADQLEDRIRDLLVERAQWMAEENEGPDRTIAEVRAEIAATSDPYELDPEDMLPNVGPYRDAVTTAERDLQQTRLTELPPAVKAAAVEAAERALAEAQERYETARAEAEGELSAGFPEPWEVAQAPSSALPGLMHQLNVRAIVSPERSPVEKRVRLVTNGDDPTEG